MWGQGNSSYIQAASEDITAITMDTALTDGVTPIKTT
jgi:hypothetical protein